jgi:hypothetical protein
LPAGHPGLTQSFPLVDLQPQKFTGTAFYTVFSPLSIPGCALWLDASDSSTVTGSSPITGWTDKSGNNQSVTINSGPEYGTTQQHGKKTMYFSGNSITTSIPTAVGTGDFTLIAVWNPYSVGLFTVLSLGTSQSSSQSLGYNGSLFNFYQFGSYESHYVTSPKWAVQIGTRIASVKKVYVTGTGATPSTSDTFDEQDTTVVIGNGDTFSITGEVAEILIYTGTMSDSNRQQLESYLAQKWGLTADLPAGHPFFTNPAGSPHVGVVKRSLTSSPAIFGSVRFTYEPVAPYAGNQYLSASVVAPNTDSVTYECWFYQTVRNSGNNTIMTSRSGVGGNGGIQIGINDYWGGFSIGTPTFLANYGFAPSLNTWHHIALVRNGTSAWTFYYDGIAKTSSQGATFTYTDTTSTDLFIGAFASSDYPQQFTGYITDFRYVVGTPVYTNNFTSPTSRLTAIAGTQLLLNTRAGYYLLNSATKLDITNINGAQYAQFEPYTPPPSVGGIPLSCISGYPKDLFAGVNIADNNDGTFGQVVIQRSAKYGVPAGYVFDTDWYFDVWDPTYITMTNANSQNNDTATALTNCYNAAWSGTTLQSKGQKVMFSIKQTVFPSPNFQSMAVGVASSTAPYIGSYVYLGLDSQSIGCYDDGTEWAIDNIQINNGDNALFESNNQIIEVAVDFDLGRMWFRVDGGVWQGHKPHPVFSLDAGNVASYDSANPTVWNDLAGSGLTTTLYNSPTYNSANGGYLSFIPSSSQYAETSASLSLLTKFTVEVWHYYNTVTSGSLPCILSEVLANSSLNFLLGNITNSPPYLQFGYFTGNVNVTPSYALPGVGWYHIVGTYDGANLKLYVNNVLINMTATTDTPTSSGAGIRFMRRWDDPDYWGGGLAIVNIYNDAITSADVTANYNAKKTRFGL